MIFMKMEWRSSELNWATIAKDEENWNRKEIYAQKVEFIVLKEFLNSIESEWLREGKLEEFP